MYGEIAVGVQLAAVIVNVIVVVAVNVPELPRIVTVTVPAVAEVPAVSVNVLLPVVGLGVKTAVTPAGKPEAESVTLPVNPFWPLTVIVSVPLAPWAIERFADVAASV